MKKIDTKTNFFIIANWTQGTGMSGGDSIWVEFSKRWKDRLNIILIGSPEALEMTKREGFLPETIYLATTKIREKNNLSILPLIKNLIIRTCQAIFHVLKNRKVFKEQPFIIYTTSDFAPEVIYGLLVKLLNKKCVWIAGFYLFAPGLMSGNSPYKGKYKLKGIFYFWVQLPVYLIVKKFADVVFVTSVPDVDKFITKKRDKQRVAVIRGGVNTKVADKHIQQKGTRKQTGTYEAAYLGRLHHQKGVMELIDIWRLVCDKKPDYRLALMGDGELEHDVRSKIQRLGLEKNIDMLDFITGEKKWNVYKQSRVFLHPATYDSGGMAAAEAMAFRIPAVGFDLEAFKTYYPKGMIKITKYDLELFAQTVIKLLDDTKLYDKVAAEARSLIEEQWSWDKRAEEIFDSYLKREMHYLQQL